MFPRQVSAGVSSRISSRSQDIRGGHHKQQTSGFFDPIRPLCVQQSSSWSGTSESKVMIKRTLLKHYDLYNRAGHWPSSVTLQNFWQPREALVGQTQDFSQSKLTDTEYCPCSSLFLCRSGQTTPTKPDHGLLVLTEHKPVYYPFCGDWERWDLTPSLKKHQ